MREHGNKAIGKTKKAIGQATGDQRLEREGRVQETTGRVQGGVNDASRKVDEAIGKMGEKLAKRRRGDRPERARRDIDREY